MEGWREYEGYDANKTEAPLANTTEAHTHTHTRARQGKPQTDTHARECVRKTKIEANAKKSENTHTQRNRHGRRKENKEGSALVCRRWKRLGSTHAAGALSSETQRGTRTSHEANGCGHGRARSRRRKGVKGEGGALVSMGRAQPVVCADEKGEVDHTHPFYVKDSSTNTHAAPLSDGGRRKAVRRGGWTSTAEALWIRAGWG